MPVKTEKFLSMELEKREKIINAALIEFSKGFDNASTDTIVREAGISKGLLFHYFETKKGLHEYLISYALDTVINEFYALVNTVQSDPLDRVWQMLLLKMDLSYKHPAIFDFVGTVYNEGREQPQSLFLDRFTKKQAEVWSNVFRFSDMSLFKEGFDNEKVLNIIFWALRGYSETKISTGKSTRDYQKEYGVYLDEVKAYLDILRKAFYK